jgi:hypothetical protein
MNLPQALQKTKDHIRIGKGMELVNGVPEALEMVVEELEVTQKVLELAEKIIADTESLFDGLQTGCVNLGDIRHSLNEGIGIIAQAKEGEK